MFGGGIGVLSGGVRPLRFRWGVLPPAHPECEVVVTTMPTTTTTSVDRPVALVVAATRIGGRAGHGHPARVGRRPAVLRQRAVRLRHHLYVDQRAVPGVGPHGPVAVRVRRTRLGRPGVARAPRPPAPQRRPVPAPTPARLAGPSGHRRVRLRGRAGHPHGPRDPVAVRRHARVTPAARGDVGRDRRAGPRQGPEPLPPPDTGATTRSSTTRRASPTTRASCPTCRSWPCWASPAKSGPTTG